MLAWFSTSFLGRHLHRAIHAQDRSEACVFCRVVWWRLFDRRLAALQAKAEAVRAEYRASRP